MNYSLVCLQKQREKALEAVIGDSLSQSYIPHFEATFVAVVSSGVVRAQVILWLIITSDHMVVPGLGSGSTVILIKKKGSQKMN